MDWPKLGRRVVVLDADLGLANIDILLGLSANKTIENVLQGNVILRDIMVKGPGGIRVVPASSGTQKLTQLNSREHAGF